MAAAQYDFFVEQGATFQKIITWKAPNNTPINLSGYTARMQFRRAVRSTDVLYSANTENGMITLGGAAGTISITIPASETEGFGFRRAVYDLEVESSGGVVTRLIEGSVELSREVTRT
jgi:hypothetical protein